MEIRQIGFILLIFVRVIFSSKQVNFLLTRGLMPLKEEDILRIIAQNKTESTNNYTFVKLIDSLGNKTIYNTRNQEIEDYTNNYYG